MFEYFEDLYWQQTIDQVQWRIYSSFCCDERHNKNMDMKNQGLSKEYLRMASIERTISNMRRFQVVLASQIQSTEQKRAKPTPYMVVEVETSQSVRIYRLPLKIKGNPLCYIKTNHNGIIIGIENYANQYFYQIWIPNDHPNRLLSMGKCPSILKIRQYCETRVSKPKKLTLFQLILNKLSMSD